MKKAFAIELKGRVQGVGFRYFVLHRAGMLNIAGFVKNRPDGSVYIEAEGEAADLEAFIGFCRQGPPRARVDDAVISKFPLQQWRSFEIR